MPIYEYYCPKCKNKFEKYQSLLQVDIEQIICENCNYLKPERQISLSTFRLIGTGWYSMGYSSKKEEKNKS